ncbi:MAG: hypothetical protein ACJ79S_18510 [Gemmatimonadaceae bacterium]
MTDITGPTTPAPAEAPPVVPARNGAAPFVTTLRARPDTIRIGEPGAGGDLTVRVQMPEVWDAVRVVLPPTEPVLALKVRALAALYPEGEYHDDFVLKLGGFEVLDESAPVAETGAVDGSTFLLTHRRRRPVR